MFIGEKVDHDLVRLTDSIPSLLEGYFHSALETLETVDHIGPLLYFHTSLQYFPEGFVVNLVIPYRQFCISMRRS